MISKQELMELAHQFSLSPQMVEKDYVLGWMLAGIAAHPSLNSVLLFKGGTCLKKCFFETYRFSEDLDYTVINNQEAIDTHGLVQAMKHIGRWIYQESGITILEETIRFNMIQNKHKQSHMEGRVGYLGRRGDPARTKFDLTLHEMMVQAPVTRPVHHPYSDYPSAVIHALCYSFEELVAEKLRALSDRACPRDLYDVIHLFRHAQIGQNGSTIQKILEKKCAYKNIPIPSWERMQNHPKRRELEEAWSSMLAHQLPTLPPFAFFWQELANIDSWLAGMPKAKLPTIPYPSHLNVDRAWTPPTMSIPRKSSISVELIRFAAANQLCILITTNTYEELFEPYAFRKDLGQQLWLAGIISSTKKVTHLALAEINQIKVTKQNFYPSFAIELTSISSTLPKEAL